MLEYVSEAVVLQREPNRDLDSRLSLFTKRFGKLVAKARSVRKITSKLSGHLQPGNVVHVRLVEKNGLQVVDALKESRLKLAPGSLYFLDRLLAEAEPDLRIWNALFEELEWRRILTVLGWDPNHATCSLCERAGPKGFHIETQEFFCTICASNLHPDRVLYID